MQELSSNRANSVKEAIVRKFPTLQPNQFTRPAVWAGSDRRIQAIRMNQAKNRRVEIKVYPLEAGK